MAADLPGPVKLTRRGRPGGSAPGEPVSARSYRGTCMVGTRWVVSGRPQTLKAFRPKLGGDIVRLTGPAGPSAP